MAFDTLPPELINNIFGYIVADYVDAAITTPPQPQWLEEVVGTDPSELRNASVVLAWWRKKKGLRNPVWIGSDRSEWSGITKEFFEKMYRRSRKENALGSYQRPAQAQALPIGFLRRSGHVEAMEDEESVWSGTGDEEESYDDFDSHEGHITSSCGSDMGRWPQYEAEESSNSDYDSDDSGDESIISHRCQTTDIDEELPENTFLPLLSINRRLRMIAQKVVSDALCTDFSNEQGIKNTNIHLRNLRSWYHVDCAEPCRCASSVVDQMENLNDFPLLIRAYVGVFDYISRMYEIVASDLNKSKLSKREYNERKFVAYNCKYFLDGMKKPSPLDLWTADAVYSSGDGRRVSESLSIWVSRRVYIKNIRHATFNIIHFHVIDMRSCFSNAIKMKPGSGGELPNTVFPKHCLKLRTSVERFSMLEKKYMDKHIFAELPGHLIKAMNIGHILGQIAGLRHFDEYMMNADLKAAADEAEVLWHNWEHRYVTSCKTFHVALIERFEP